MAFPRHASSRACLVRKPRGRGFGRRFPRVVPRCHSRSGRRCPRTRHTQPRDLRLTALRILFDQGTPAPLRRAFTEHTVETAFERGWANLQNGALIEAAGAADFSVLVTT